VKKVLSITLVLAMVLAFAAPAMAANIKVVGEKDGAVLFSEANEWTVSVPAAGTVTVKDNKVEYTFDFDEEGTYSLGLQKVYTGQLSLVSFVVAEVPHVCVFEFVEKVAPTCVDKGYTLLACECEAEKKVNWKKALGHDDGEWRVIDEATYDAAGLEGLYCIRCGELLRTEIIPQLKKITENPDGSITINVSGTYSLSDFPTLARGQAWRVNNSGSIQDGSGWAGGYLNAGDILYNVRNQNQQ